MKAAYSSLQKYISQELPYISLVFRESNLYTSSRIDGDMAPIMYSVYNGIEKVKIKE